MIEIVEANYQNPLHRKHIPELLDQYARDPMGGNCPLPDTVKARLVDELSQRPHTFTVLAYHGDQPVGIANCVEGFSTFAAKSLINIHDIAVIPDYRGQGICKQLLNKIEAIAKRRNSCKITLEVLSKNTPAQSAYRKFGFEGYQLSEEGGHALFWQKVL